MKAGPKMKRVPARSAGWWRVMFLAGILLGTSVVHGDEPAKNASGADRPKVHKMYRCQDGAGKTVFSDRPCGPGAVPREVRVQPAVPTLGERCMAENDQEACLQLNRLRRENPEAAMAEIHAGQEAARRKSEQAQLLQQRIFECIERGERYEFQTRRQLDGRTKRAIQDRCRANPD